MKKYFAGDFVTYHEYGELKVGVIVEIDHFDNETYVVLSDYSDSNVAHHNIIKEDMIINVVNLNAVTTMLQVL